MQAQALAAFLDQILDNGAIADGTWNGLQVQLPHEQDHVSKVAFAVDSSLAVFEEAGCQGCQFLCVHHGLIWGSIQRIHGTLAQRLACLFRHGVHLYVSHLPLDLHTEYGHNALIIKALELRAVDRFYEVGWIAEGQPMRLADLMHRLTELGIPPQRTIAAGPEQFTRIAVCTGMVGHNKAVLEAVTKSASWIVTGETNSTLYHEARELGVGVLVCGHYATEVFGMLALKTLVSERFPDLESVWIDQPTSW